MITSLTQQEARGLLTVNKVGRLGCVYEGGPYVVPVNYVLDGESIYVHSLPGRKLEALRANPRACLQVDKVTDAYHWGSAIAFGVYEEINDQNERDRAVQALLARFPNLTPVESVPVHDGQSSVVIFRIRIQEITGVGEKVNSTLAAGIYMRHGRTRQNITNCNQATPLLTCVDVL